MISLSFFLARRFLRSSSHEQALNTMMWLSIITLIISSCALALVASIMQGFEKKTYQQFQGINPDIIIKNDTTRDYETTRNNLKEHFKQEIVGITPFAFNYGMLERPESNAKQMVIKLMAVDVSSIDSVISISALIKNNTYQPIEQLLNRRNCIIGAALARSLALKSGSKAHLLYIPEQENNSNKLTFDKLTIRISERIKSGIEDFDEQIVICSLELFNELFPNHAIDQIGIKIGHPERLALVAQDIASFLGSSFDVIPWYDLYPAIFAAMKLEKYIAILVIALMCLLTGSCISALMFMITTAKRQDCAILQAMGCTYQDINRAFMIMGVGLTMIATSIGLCCAGIISYMLEYGRLITIPDIYYTTHVPADFTLFIAASIFIFMLVLSACASWIPIRTMHRISIIKLLKFN